MKDTLAILKEHLTFRLVKILFKGTDAEKYSVELLSKDNNAGIGTHIYLTKDEYRYIKQDIKIDESCLDKVEE